MKTITFLTLYLSIQCVASARLGETPKQIFERYGRRALWACQPINGSLPDKCFLSEQCSFYHVFYGYHFGDKDKQHIGARVSSVICYKTDEMEQIQVYYDRVTNKSIAEIFKPKPLDEHSFFNRADYNLANSENCKKQAMLIGPKAAGVDNFELCPDWHGKNNRTYFSRTAPRTVFALSSWIGAVELFGVVELNESSSCYLQYLERVKSATKDLKKADKY
jgi:hypothetical protein